MLSREIRKELEEDYGARILSISPYVAKNSDGEYEQFYQVNMMTREESFYVDVDEWGAVLGGRGTKHDVYRF